MLTATDSTKPSINAVKIGNLTGDRSKMLLRKRKKRNTSLKKKRRKKRNLGMTALVVRIFLISEWTYSKKNRSLKKARSTWMILNPESSRLFRALHLFSEMR